VEKGRHVEGLGLPRGEELGDCLGVGILAWWQGGVSKDGVTEFGVKRRTGVADPDLRVHQPHLRGSLVHRYHGLGPETPLSSRAPATVAIWLGHRH